MSSTSTLEALNARRKSSKYTVRLHSYTTSVGHGPKMTIRESPSPADYATWSHADLIARVIHLDGQLRAQNALFRHELPSPLPDVSDSISPSKISRSDDVPHRHQPPSPSRRASPFDSSKYTTRYIALKFAYLGGAYNGYEHANGNVTSLPVIEEVVWCALRKARLINPESDESVEVLWDGTQRLARGPLILNWEGCQYSKCGRTDKGVSAFGQVIGVRVRSNKRLLRERNSAVTYSGLNGEEEHNDDTGLLFSELAKIDDEELVPDTPQCSFDPIKDELPYISILNSILPSDIRILAWCPHPPPDFNARFSCQERRYKYFFTNPAFCPTPGPLGFQDSAGRKTAIREGWQDIDAMRDAAKKLVGLHDFRNFCKVDPSKQMTSFERRIRVAEIEECEQQSGSKWFSGWRTDSIVEGFDGQAIFGNGVSEPASGPKTYSFTVHGSAFLWHQVRCMVAVLFLVGQGLESSNLVDELLDIENNPCKPSYEMASDAPLVLWDCIFPAADNADREDALDWIYAGDERLLSSHPPKGNGNLAMGGVIDDLWSTWRKYKMNEILSSSLLDVVFKQSDGSAIHRGVSRDNGSVKVRSQKLFDGGDAVRRVGKYVPVMQKAKLASVDTQNAKYRAGKGARKRVGQAE